MCEEKHEFTTELFEETFGDNDSDAYYIYYCNDDKLMRFLSEDFDEKFGAFTTDFSKAAIFTKSQAQMGLLLGAVLLDYELHVVHIETKVTWDC